MKILNVLRRKKLRAATARRSGGASAEMGYGEISEPNMKLSRALLIVLLLHVVAVSGIISFNAIKTRQSSFVPAKPENNPFATTESTISSNASNPQTPLAQKENVLRDEAKTARSLSKPLATDERPKLSEDKQAPAPSGKVYTVVKCDNPVTIAKKLKVSQDDLLSLNHIDDPRKLQIGQKLLIPSKTTKAKAKKRNE